MATTAREIFDGFRDIKVGQVVKNTFGHFKVGDAQEPDYVEDVLVNDMPEDEFAAKMAQWQAIPCPENVCVVGVRKYTNASGEPETEVVVAPIAST